MDAELLARHGPLARTTLARLVPPGDLAVVEWLLAQGSLEEVAEGHRLVLTDRPPTLGILLQGRLDAKTRTIRPGMAFGEEPFVGRERHEASLLSLRASAVYSLSLETFDQGLALHGAALLGLLRQLASRHQETRRGVLALGEGTQELATCLRREPGVLVVKPRLDATLTDLWLAELEQQHARIFLEYHPDEGWQRFASLHADGSLTWQQHASAFRPVLSPAGKTPFPALPGSVRPLDAEALQRTARLLAGTGKGLVLSGGGARGFAHIGALKALRERGWEPDSVGGTSMGALVGGLWALHRDTDVLLDLAKTLGRSSRILDWVPGATSLTRGRKVARLLDDLFGSTRIDELELPFFCVATDLTRAREVVFSTGPVAAAVRASLAIPGVFYPVVRQGSILVDGGLMNNLPLDVLARRLHGGTLLACDVTSGDWLAPAGWTGAHQASRSAWKQLFDQFRPSTRKKVPALADLLLQSLEVNSRRHFRENAPASHLCLGINVARFDPLDFGRWKSLVDEGYSQTCHYIDSVLY